jgi:general secretion pathway protein H
LTGRRNSRSSRRLDHPQSGGFTLIEVALVLLIMGVVLALMVPRLRDPAHTELVSHARRLAVTLRFVRHEAILNGRTYRLNYDLNEQRYWVTSSEGEDESGSFVNETGVLVKPVTFPPPLAFSDIFLPWTAGQVREGQGFTNFYPDGVVDLTLVHLDNGQEAYTLLIDPITGHVSVAAGYHEIPG